MAVTPITPAGRSLQVKTAKILVPSTAVQGAGDVTDELFGVAKDDIIAYFTVFTTGAGDSTSALMDLGVTGALTQYATDIDVNIARSAVSDAAGAGTTTGPIGTGITNVPETADSIIKATTTYTAGDATEGTAIYVSMYYYSVPRGEL